MRIQEPLTDSLFNGPCPFCGYNGPGYWQPGTHADGCPCHEIYRGESQEDGLRAYIATLRAENTRLREVAEISESASNSKSLLCKESNLRLEKAHAENARLKEVVGELRDALAKLEAAYTQIEELEQLVQELGEALQER